MTTQTLQRAELTDLVDWAVRVSETEIPDASLTSARAVLLDDLTATVAGHRDPEVVRLFADWPLLAGSATILSSPRRVAHPWSAAELNGVASCWLELEGGFRTATAHAGLYTVPTSVAVAEAADMPTSTVLAAMIVGYEFAARIVTRWNLSAAGSHAHGSVAPVAAAAAGAKLMDLGNAEFFRAVTSAATMAMAAPFNHAVHGALSRNIWAGQAARLGLTAIQGARHKVGGLSTSFADTYTTAFGAPPWEGAALGEYGTAIQAAYHKQYACCQYLHSSVEAALELYGQLARNADSLAIERVHAEVHPWGARLSRSNPETTLGAKFSLPHAVAAALVIGDGGPAAFSIDSLSDERIARVRQLVSIATRPPRADRSDLRDCTLRVDLRDGQTVTARVETPIGDPERPLGHPLLIDKFASLTRAENSARDLASSLLAGDSDGLPIRGLIERLFRER